MAVRLNVREPKMGKASGDLTVDATAPGRRVAGDLALEHLNVGVFVRDDGSGRRAVAPLRSDITGRARFDLALPSGRLPLSGTYEVDAGRVHAAGYDASNVVARGRIDGEIIRVGAASGNAYGARFTTSGTVRTGGDLTLDLKGRAQRVDLRNLPELLDVPDVPSDLAFEYAVARHGGVFTGAVTLDESRLAGATIAAGTTGKVRLGRGEAPQYGSAGQISGLDLQQIGEGFDIKALASDRYRSRVNARFDVSGSGGGRFPLTLDTTGAIDDSEIFGARIPQMDVTAHLGEGDLQVTTKGGFSNLDPAVVSGNSRAAGMLSGSVDAATTIRSYADGVTVDTIDVAGRLELSDSTVGDFAIGKALVDGDYAGREGTLRDLTITGPDINATGKGRIELTDSGSTDLTLHVDTASLEEIGKIVGQPLAGSVIVDAVLTGNARTLEARGTLMGSDLGHGENQALSLKSEFTASIPDLTPAEASVKAKSMATFVEVGGQKITELAADVTYAGSRLQFDATAQEGVRELRAGGTAIFHTDHQEIHLPTLVLKSEKIEWSTPAGSETAVRYSKDRIAIDGLVLANGNQRISADGVLGAQEEPLRVRIENVDVAEVDRLLLGDQRLGGRFNADATITGPMNAPRVDARFALTGGSFRTYKFESLQGEVDYAERDVTLDVRLQQTPSMWLTAKGHAPLTLFQPTPESRAREHQPATPGDEVDIEVASSQVELGVIQGFTSEVTDVKGIMQANVRVTGSGYDPHVNGAIDIRGGAFAAPGLGTAYTGLDTRIDLNDEGISIGEFRVLDDRGFPLTVGGTLAVHARSVGAVNITLHSEKFEVIDNRYADLKLNTDIKVTGEIRKPHVEGTIEIENGTIHVAELIDRVTARAYATEATTLPGEDARPPAEPETPAAEPGTPPEPSVFDALSTDVVLSIPSNLVLRGNDVRAARAPVAIGDVNITVGGNIQVRKQAGDTMTLTGDVNTVRGTYTFQGRRFDIQRDGRIGFPGSGLEELDPLLDLQARRVISGVETFVRVRGTMRNPELSFSSNPPLDEADILSLIVFNQPINELGEGQQVSLAERAGALASGYLTSGLARSIGSALELDEFEIQAQGEEGSGPSLIVGEQVGRNLFFRLRQAFGSEQTTELILEYQIAEFLRLQASTVQGSLSQRVQFRRVERAGLDLVFFFSY
jgi:autotransporter translocation and assembly factor TamB